MCRDPGVARVSSGSPPRQRRHIRAENYPVQTGLIERSAIRQAEMDSIVMCK